MPQNPIISLKLEEEAHRLRGEGKSVRKMAEALSSTSGKRIYPNTVQAYFNRFPGRPEVVEVMLTRPPDEPSVAASVLESIVNTTHQVDNTIKIIHKTIERALETNDDDLLIKSIKEAKGYYRLKAELVGDLGPKNQITQNVQNNVMIYIPSNGRN